MTTRDFVYWLQGYFEISDTKTMTEREIGVVKNHLNLVFKHDIDPSFGLTPEQDKESQDIHDGNRPWNIRRDSDLVVKC